MNSPAPRRKRIVVCCDGTWNRPDSPHVTNVEKIARSIQTDPSASGGVPQLVYYLSGVGGAGYKADRVLGGAFGFGLFNNIVSAYRFLAQNYETGDEIFIFGFSRGAYTARSLAGMVGRVGLLTRKALVEEKLAEAVSRYRRTDPAGGQAGSSTAEFKRDYCHDAPVQFLGVFDTVGALGVPGAMRLAPKFHDVQLSAAVRCARQALAIDECRMKFEPSLWQAPPNGSTDDNRVKQVWFEGVHSDVGGGYAETGLSDTALLWMAVEANEMGLVFDEPLFSYYAASRSSAIRHNSLKPLFRLLNLVPLLKARLRRSGPAGFVGNRRRLDIDGAVSVRLASSALDHVLAKEDYAPANLGAVVDLSDPAQARIVIEKVVALPDANASELIKALAFRPSS